MPDLFTRINQIKTAAARDRQPPPQTIQQTRALRPPAGGEILFGKPTGAFTGPASTITLDPCDIKGTDNGKANVTVYLLPGQTNEDITSATIAGSAQGVTCSLGTGTIIPYHKDAAGDYYVVGTKKQVMTEFRYYASSPTFQLQCKMRFDWGMFCSSESDWDVVTSNMSQCS